MTIGIIGAMEEEVELLKNSMPSVEEIVLNFTLAKLLAKK
ncbi:5'-methylthioadenosine/S-adenosylhomocysteine nucleosidase [Listeria monocytogenes N53-1]|nr:5'-methylthioadenosine/S-adenosylhomocysteine nucleosidase [Listeria monocytogenes]CCQ24070.1 5'-methylthioadenosine/S-adenosylhomocysteine nucleosidase [Listeria monocytogenes N53-1]